MRKRPSVILASLFISAQLFAAPKFGVSQAILKLLNSRAAGSPRDFEEAAEIVAKDAAEGKSVQQFVLAVVSRDANVPEVARLDDATRKRYFDQSRDKIKEMAEKGNAMSLYLLSLETNDPALLKRAAEAGNVQAMNAWGTYAMEQAFNSGTMLQEDVERMVGKSYGYFKAAADRGDANGLYNVGMCHLCGWGVAENKEKAFEHFKAAAMLGHAGAINNIGGFYRDGMVVEQDFAIATKWFRKSANLGNPYGQLNYGFALQRGEGVEQDDKKAFAMYRAAAEGGSEEAKNAVGMCYYNGTGVKKDEHEAVKWFTAAAKDGVAAAMENLSECYDTGAGGLERDPTQAMVWKIRARAANGDKNAATWLAQNGYTPR